MADPSDTDVQRVFERFNTSSARPQGPRIRRRLSLFPWVGGADGVTTEIPVDEPSGSDGQAPDLDTGTIIYDGGFTDAPTFNNQGNGKRASGTTKDFAKFLFSIGIPQAGYTYTMTYDPDFSGLSQGGALAMVGFGFKQQNKYHFSGLRGDGSTGINVYKVSGSNFNTLKATTEVDGGAATHGTQAGPNWLRITIAADGTTYTLSTSSDGSAWAAEFTDSLPSPISTATGASDFGIALYLDGADIGSFTVDITLWMQETIPAEGVLTDFFAANGATWPNYGLNMLPGLYHSASTRTYYTWEAWTSGGREAYVSRWDHTGGAAGELLSAGVTSLNDNDHGNPSFAVDHEGHGWVFHNSHQSTGLVKSTDVPLASNHDWIARTSHSGALTYPKPHAIGTGLFVLYREASVAGGGSDNGRYLTLFETTALADGVATWAASVRLVDFGTNRVYAGNSVIRGTEIHFLGAVAPSNDSIREHVYYFIYDTADGSLSNWNKSTTTASGSLPVTLTLANSDYRIFAHTGGNGGGVAGLAFDTNNVPHVLFTDGSGTSYALKHMTVAGGAWITPETLDTLDERYMTGAIGPLPSGKMEVVYPKDETSSFARSGTAILRREMSAAGVWGTVHTLLAADTKALGEVNPVRNAHTDARFTWCEIAGSSLDANAGGLRVYIWGASGLLNRAAPVPFAPDDATGNLTLGTDNLVLGTDNLLIDTTV